jgi:DNA polymerase-3 subunit gamma/tau
VALALYRKYRSATFAELIGQEHVTVPMMQSLSAGRINHAYLFSGPRGCGKTSSARILARSLNCAQGPIPQPCGECASCRDLAPNGTGSIDVIEIDAASHNGVDDARDLRERAYYAPVRDRYKVYIIDEAHMVTTQAFNALLKLVEEPPDFVIFIFATTEPDKVLQTIRSRTHHYPFRLVPPSVLRSHLERICVAEGAVVEATVFPLVVRAGGGSVRDSLSILDQLLAGAGPEGVKYANAIGLLGVTDSALLDDMTDALAVGDSAGVYETIDRVVEAGHDPRRFAADLLERFRDLIILDAVPDAVETGLIDYPADQAEQMAGQSRRIGSASLVRFADITHTTLTDMRGTTSPRLMLELLCARMLLPDAAADSVALLQRIERLERRQGMVAVPSEVRQDEPVRTEAAPAMQVRDEPAISVPSTSVPVTATPVTAEPAKPGPETSVPVAAEPVSPVAAQSAESSVGSAPSAERIMRLVASEAPTSSAPQPITQAASDAAPPAPPPLPTSTPSRPTNGTDSAGLRRLWPDVLEQVKVRSRRTRALLDNASVASVDGNLIRLTASSPALAKMIADDSNQAVLREALDAVVGGGWQIEVGIESVPAQTQRSGFASSGGGSAVGSQTSADPSGPPRPESDGVDEDADAVHGIKSGGVDPEAAAIRLLRDSLGARPLD